MPKPKLPAGSVSSAGGAARPSRKSPTPSNGPSRMRTDRLVRSVGGTIADAAQALVDKATADQVRGVVEQLFSDGYLYSTIDDDHFKVTVTN